MLHCSTCGRSYSPETEVCPFDHSALQADPTIAASTGDPLLGQLLDNKYLIQERLGVGGMGTVYRAMHLLIDRPVAVKVLNQRFVGDEAAEIRFRREAKATGRLQHANAVTATDFGHTSDGYVYIVMELLEGQTLREVLAREAPLETARAVSIMLQATAAVAAAHDAGIIHRDLKPANVFIVRRADMPVIVKVLDFGIAKLASETLEEGDNETLTVVGAMIGTPRYMSPEQCNGADLTPAADVYSLGVILYEMLTGIVPFSGSTPLAIAIKHAAEQPRDPREITASIPGALAELVLHALEKQPEDRPQDASKFRRELLSVAERLGLENSELAGAPDLETLRGIGTESPSGRLIIDLARLRQSRASGSPPGGGDITLVSATPRAQDTGYNRDAPTGFPRISVSFKDRVTRKQGAWFASVIAMVIVLGGTFFGLRSKGTAPASVVVVTASPSPSVEPTPTPSPVASIQPEEPKRKPENANKKRESKVGSILKKAGRIFKKPF